MYMPSNAVDVKVTGAVGTILLNRPNRRNALTRAMLGQLGQALGDLHLEKRVRAIILERERRADWTQQLRETPA